MPSIKLTQKLALASLFSLVQFSCTSFSGYPETDISNLPQAENVVFMISDEERKTVTTIESRNLLMHKKTNQINVSYMNFESSIYKENIAMDFATDISTLVLTGATALVGGERAKANLGALSALIIGGKAAYDQKALMANSMHVLVQKMRADRATVETSLRRGEGQPLGQYSVDQLATDLARYYYAGTFPSALNGISEEAVVQQREAEEEQQNIQEFRFMADGARECLLGYWRPNETVDQTRQLLIQSWIATSDYPDMFFGELMNASSAAEVRVEVVMYLMEQGELTDCTL